MQWLPPDTESRKGQLEGARALLILTPTKLSPTPKAELAGMECFVTTEKTKLLLLRLIHVPVFRLPPLLCCHSCILLTNDPEPLQPILLLPGRCLPRRDAEAAQGYIVSARASKAGSEVSESTTLQHLETLAITAAIPTIGDRKQSSGSDPSGVYRDDDALWVVEARLRATTRQCLPVSLSMEGAPRAFSRLPSTWPGRPRAPAYS